MADGCRESEQSWHGVLIDLKQRGLVSKSLLAIGDGPLGFWAVLRKVYPQTCEQCCLVPKTANVLNKIPKGVQPKAKADLHEACIAETRADAEKAFDNFLEKYRARYASACECLKKAHDVLLVFYDFPAERWKHPWTSNSIQWAFVKARLRHRHSQGSGSRRADLMMMFMLWKSAKER